MPLLKILIFRAAGCGNVGADIIRPYIGCYIHR